MRFRSRKAGLSSAGFEYRTDDMGEVQLMPGSMASEPYIFVLQGLVGDMQSAERISA